MTGRSGQIDAWDFAVARATMAACTVFLLVPALAQEARPPAEIPSQNAGAAAANPPPAAPNSMPGPSLVDTIGRWFDDGTTKFKSNLQGAQQSFDEFADQTRDAAKDATGAVMGLPNARIVTVRERCAAAQNGAPDCQAAAAAACRGKGFQTGKSVDTQSEHKCPAQVLLKGRAPNDVECSTEIFVTRAVCQ
jgi:hypothetical protein